MLACARATRTAGRFDYFILGLFLKAFILSGCESERGGFGRYGGGGGAEACPQPFDVMTTRFILLPAEIGAPCCIIGNYLFHMQKGLSRNGREGGTLFPAYCQVFWCVQSQPCRVSGISRN